ncbi:DsbA family protein [Agriterribacter humi]|jgi:protein-disulfide isomerase|uniref:DsbA family protein n=1 Tax=Agriterribacter humi TaxID=1104781 RepID=UPI0012650A4C|nr:thioredoxin domain-containing protein [Agriterribacter humi]
MTQLIPAVNSNDHIYGNLNAALELVEYGDYQCPYCGRAYPIIKNILRKSGADLKFIFRNFPLSKIHPLALPAAIATEAAALQDKFWEMHDIIFEKQQTLEAESFFLFAETTGLDPERFKSDIQRKDLAEKVQHDFESGLRSGVNRTPSFFINGKKYDSDWEEDELLEYLKDQLAEISIS